MAEGGEEMPTRVDVIASMNSSNYMKLQKISVDIGCYTLRQLLHYLTTGDPNRREVTQFDEFLNISTVRCDLFQLKRMNSNTRECCICGEGRFHFILSDDQWEELYNMKVHINCTNVNMESVIHCCVYRAVVGVLGQLDVTLMSCILTNVSLINNNDQIQHLINNIRNHRNYLAHLNTTEILDDDFSFRFKDLRRTLGDLMGLSGDRGLVKTVLSEIDRVRDMTITKQDVDVPHSAVESIEREQSISGTFRDELFSQLQTLQALDDEYNVIIDEISDIIDGIFEITQECLMLATRINILS